MRETVPSRLFTTQTAPCRTRFPVGHFPPGFPARPFPPSDRYVRRDLPHAGSPRARRRRPRARLPRLESVFLGAPLTRVDSRDRPVADVRYPDRACRVGNSDREVADVARLHLGVGVGIDSRDGSIQAVGHPDRARAGRDAVRAAAHGDRVDHGPRRRVDPRHAVVVGVGDPVGALAHDHAGRCRADRDVSDELVRARVEDGHGVAGYTRGRRARTVAPECEHRQDRCDHDGDERSHEDEPPPARPRHGEGRLDLGGRRHGRLEGRIVDEDRPLESLEGLARLEPELLVQHSAGILVGSESLGLSIRAVEGEHELAAKPLAERVCTDQRLELADQRPVAARSEIGVDALLDSRHASLFEARDLGLCERIEGEVRKCRATPKRQSLEERLGCLLRSTCAKRPSAVFHEPLELGQSPARPA